MSHPRVKICGLVRREDAELADRSGADFGGVILAPGGRRTVTAEHARSLLDGLSLRRVGVFVDAGADELRRAADVVGLDVLQLHGSEPPELAGTLRAERRWTVWKAVRPRTAEELLDAVRDFADVVDGLVLDGWSAAAAGGTGSRFPWHEVAAHRNRIPDQLQLVVAGGLGPANVAEAVSLLRPAVVDVSSGVELSPGVKDPDAVAAFVRAARAGGPLPEKSH